jgi:non-specific protein-tyrosine kinase
MTDLLTSLRDAYDVVLIDAAPLLPVTDAAVLASRVDGVLVVVRHGRTRVQDVCAARDALHVVDGRILGSVLTMVGHTGPRRRTRLTRFRSVSRAWSPIGRPSVNGASRAAAPVPTAPPQPPVPAPALPPEPFRPSPRPRSNPDALAEPSNGDGSPKPSERDGSPKSADGDGQSETSVVDEAVDRGSAAR